MPPRGYSRQIFEPLFSEYPEDFKVHCKSLFSQHKENFAAFFSSLNEHSIFAKLSSEDFSYSHGVYMGLTNAGIARKLGISVHTANKKIQKLCEKLGVNGKKNLMEYLHKNM